MLISQAALFFRVDLPHLCTRGVIPPNTSRNTLNNISFVVSCWILVIHVVMPFGRIVRCGCSSVRFLVWPMSVYLCFTHLCNFTTHYLFKVVNFRISLQLSSHWKNCILNVMRKLSPESQYEELLVGSSHCLDHSIRLFDVPYELQPLITKSLD